MPRRFPSVHDLLDRPLTIGARLVVLAGTLALVIGALLPLWRILLTAPLP